MKLYEQKKDTKQEWKKEKIKCDKKLNKKKRKDNKMLNQKREKEVGKKLDKKQ
jgi:hypothetical protein